ncbi:MAG: DUF2169 domain-containing protein [Polyangiaceae bacterium]
MKVIKPRALSVMVRPLRLDDRAYLCVSVMTLFHVDQPGWMGHEAALWQHVAELLHEGLDIFDEGLPKAHPEVMVDGFAYPVNPPQTACQSRLRLGTVDKTVLAIGDRRWMTGGTPSPPEPFTSMPLTWERAFGGPGFTDNSRGRGVDVGRGAMLANLQRPGEQARSPSDQLSAVTLSSLPLGHSQRQKYACGRGVDRRRYQLAPEDQWLDRLDDAETFDLQRMHPARSSISGRLPGLAVRALVAFSESGVDPHHVEMKPETVRLWPHIERGVVIYRGLAAVRESDADDVKVVLVGAESSATPRSREHYEAALRRRLDPEGGAVVSLDESDLLPDGVRPELEMALPVSGIFRERQRAQAEHQLAAARKALEDQGLDPDEYGVPQTLPKPSDRGPAGEDDARSLVDAAQREAAEQQGQAAARIRQFCDENGWDYDEMLAAAGLESTRPPSFSASRTLEELREKVILGRNAGLPFTDIETLIADPEGLAARLAEMERLVVDVYRRFAHTSGQPPARDAESGRELRRVLMAAAKQGESVRGLDLTGVDLSGISLRGADLRGVFLAGAVLADADLSSARLDDAVLAHADLRRARLAEATLHRTNLGGCDLEGADLDGAMGHETVLATARLFGATARSSRWRDIDARGTTFDQAVLSGATFERLTASDPTSWRSCDLRGARFEQAVMAGAHAQGADLSQCTIHRCALVDVSLEHASLAEASVTETLFSGDVRMAASDWTRATIVKSTLRHAHLEKASMREAVLDQVDLSHADLREASLYRARARGCLWSRARLDRASLISLDASRGVFDRASLCGADLTGAHLYAASLYETHVDSKTAFTDAVLSRAITATLNEDAP